jgi:hypothetical protein
MTLKSNMSKYTGYTHNNQVIKCAQALAGIWRHQSYFICREAEILAQARSKDIQTLEQLERAHDEYLGVHLQRIDNCYQDNFIHTEELEIANLKYKLDREYIPIYYCHTPHEMLCYKSGSPVFIRVPAIVFALMKAKISCVYGLMMYILYDMNHEHIKLKEVCHAALLHISEEDLIKLIVQYLSNSNQLDS